MKPPRLVPLLAATALAGCALGPRPLAPVAPTPTAWNGQADSTAWPSADWWHAFGSPELDRLIADAEANNDDIAAATARVHEADAQARIAGAALLPTLSAAPVVGDTRKLSPTGAVRRYGTLNGVFSASYEIDLWGKNHDAHLAADETTLAATDQVAVTRLTIVTGVATTYVNLLATQDRIVDARGAADAAQKILDGLVIQQQHGLVTGLQVAQQRTVAEQLAAAIPPLEAQRTHLLDALALLTGRSPEGFSVAGGSLADLHLPAVAAGLPSGLLVHRPDVQAAERQLAAADADISVARKSFLPSFGLTGDGGVGSVALSSALAGPASIFDIGLNVLQPIFDGGKLKGQLQQANGRYEELAAVYLKAIHQAYGDVEDALATEQGARLETAQQDQAAASAEQALAMARTAYAAGTTDTLTLLAAQQALASAQSHQTQADLDQAEGIIDLYKALGGGWSLPS
jgi:NodT family efflux transporter outer membrane factor (OMF) lipoprotein